jgi:hypothetical protein
MITERLEIGKIEILPDGQIQTRQDTVIERDGVEIARTYHRRVLEPGQPVDTEADARVATVAAVLWTPDVVKAFADKKKAQLPPGDIKPAPVDPPIDITPVEIAPAGKIK